MLAALSADRTEFTEENSTYYGRRLITTESEDLAKIKEMTVDLVLIEKRTRFHIFGGDDNILLPLR